VARFEENHEPAAGVDLDVADPSSLRIGGADIPFAERPPLVVENVNYLIVVHDEEMAGTGGQEPRVSNAARLLPDVPQEFPRSRVPDDMDLVAGIAGRDKREDVDVAEVIRVPVIGIVEGSSRADLIPDRADERTRGREPVNPVPPLVHDQDVSRELRGQADRLRIVRPRVRRRREPLGDEIAFGREFLDSLLPAVFPPEAQELALPIDRQTERPDDPALFVEPEGPGSQKFTVEIVGLDQAPLDIGDIDGPGGVDGERDRSFKLPVVGSSHPPLPQELPPG
jgi:hypothetical protein